jgi:hypothetical protein
MRRQEHFGARKEFRLCSRALALVPGLKPISGMERFSRWTKVQLPLLKQGAPDRNNKVSDIGRPRRQTCACAGSAWRGQRYTLRLELPHNFHYAASAVSRCAAIFWYRRP